MSSLARLERRLDQAVERFERVEARLGAATDGAEIVKLGQEHEIGRASCRERV